MNFTLNRKTQEEIDQERNQDRFYARTVKGQPKDICPMTVTLRTGKTIEVWDLEEDKILSLVDANMMQISGKQERQLDKNKESFEIIKCWQQKHKDVSVDFIEGYFGLKDKYSKHSSVVDDFMVPPVHEKVDKAKIIADYLNGMQGDKKEITSQNIIKILRNQEMIAQNRKEFNDSKKI